MIRNSMTQNFLEQGVFLFLSAFHPLFASSPRPQIKPRVKTRLHLGCGLYAAIGAVSDHFFFYNQEINNSTTQ